MTIEEQLRLLKQNALKMIEELDATLSSIETNNIIKRIEDAIAETGEILDSYTQATNQ